MIFRNREDAGQQLARALAPYDTSLDTIVIALPRGGVVVGAEMAAALHLPLDIVCPHKIGAPGNPEYAIGAVTESGEELETGRIIESERAKIASKLKFYRGERPPRDLKGTSD